MLKVIYMVFGMSTFTKAEFQNCKHLKQIHIFILLIFMEPSNVAFQLLCCSSYFFYYLWVERDQSHKVLHSSFHQLKHSSFLNHNVGHSYHEGKTFLTPHLYKYKKFSLKLVFILFYEENQKDCRLIKTKLPWYIHYQKCTSLNR